MIYSSYSPWERHQNEKDGEEEGSEIKDLRLENEKFEATEKKLLQSKTHFAFSFFLLPPFSKLLVPFALASFHHFLHPRLIYMVAKENCHLLVEYSYMSSWCFCSWIFQMLGIVSILILFTVNVLSHRKSHFLSNLPHLNTVLKHMKLLICSNISNMSLCKIKYIQ